jgi:hypothetical protein
MFLEQDYVSSVLQADGAQSISLHPLHPLHPNFRHLRDSLARFSQQTDTVGGTTTTRTTHAITLKRKATTASDQDCVESCTPLSTAVDGQSKRRKSARMGTGGYRPRKLN